MARTELSLLWRAGNVRRRFTRELPQSLLAIGVLGVLTACRRIEHMLVFEDAIVVRTKRRHWGGVCLGSIIFVEHDAGPRLVQHEYGHVLQSSELGWRYLPMVGLPSLWSAMVNPALHAQHRVERDAQERADRYFGGV